MKKTLRIERPTDDFADFYLDGEAIYQTNHDDHGWAGMEAVEEALRAVARIEGWEVQDGSR